PTYTLSLHDALPISTAVVNVLQKTRLYANANAPPAGNLLDLLRTYEATLKADTADAGDLAAALTALRGGINTILASPATFLNPRSEEHTSELQSRSE